MDHAAFAELTAGRAIGDLDQEERRSIERHLPVCSRCRALGQELDEVLSGLALLAPARPVPAGLGAGVLARIRADATGTEVWQMPAPVGGLRSRLTVPAWLGAGLGSAAVVVIAALGLQVGSLRAENDGWRQLAQAATAELETRASAMAVLADPAHATAWLAPSEGRTGHGALVLFVPGAAEAWVVADDLPPTPEGFVYRFWHADEAGVHGGKAFAWDGRGVLSVEVPVDLGDASAAMLTLEPASADPDAAPGEDVVFGEIRATS